MFSQVNTAYIMAYPIELDINIKMGAMDIASELVHKRYILKSLLILSSINMLERSLKET